MDTVYKLPFELSFQVLYKKTGEYADSTYFTLNKEEVDRVKKISIQENDEVLIYFNSLDKEARLYLEALDSIPIKYGIRIDEEGEIYTGISEDKIPLYKNTGDFDALRVDECIILVRCNGKKYYGILSIEPKQLNSEEWRIMKDDLEEEINGLAMDIVRKNIGIGEKDIPDIPPDHIIKFLVMKKYERRVIQALIDIQEKPKFKILKQYKLKNQSDFVNLDSYSIKQYLRRADNEHYFTPKKVISYDISENRVLKYILSYYKKELRKILLVINKSLENLKVIEEENRQYRYIYNETLQQYKKAVKRLEKVTNIIEQENWFREINENTDRNISHALAMDVRYGTIYKMYRELKASKIRVSIDPMYSYSWKKSSTLYEMWCYIKICRVLQKKYEMLGDLVTQSIESEVIVPFLKKETKTVFLSNDIKLEVLYNPILKKDRKKAEEAKMPYYMLGDHIKPDIVINIFCVQRNNMYIGSIVLECKYRKLSSFWYGDTMSSRRQIEEYYEDSKSYCYYNMQDRHDVRPVRRVFVLTPDDVDLSERERKVSLRQFKPKDDNKQQDLLIEIEEIIKDRLNEALRDK